jgi:hypothetical protein
MAKPSPSPNFPSDIKEMETKAAPSMIPRTSSRRVIECDKKNIMIPADPERANRYTGIRRLFRSHMEAADKKNSRENKAIMINLQSNMIKIRFTERE